MCLCDLTLMSIMFNVLQGYIKRQALYACLTCVPEAKTDKKKRAGVCLACTYKCHEGHDLVELYTKRNFRCDCGTSKILSIRCKLDPMKMEDNELNTYNQNFSGVYCTCHRPYPDPEDTIDDEMIQCILCEDWYHFRHLESDVPDVNAFEEMICSGCTKRTQFLQYYGEQSIIASESLNVTVKESDQSMVDVEHDTALPSSKLKQSREEPAGPIKNTNGDQAEVKPTEENPAKEKAAEEETATPAEDKAVEDKPVEAESADDMPVEKKSVEGMPVEEKLIEDKPVDEKSGKDKPVEDKSAEDKPTEMKSFEDKPSEEKSNKVQAAEETSIEDKPDEENAAKDRPVEGKLVEDKLVEEKVADEKSADKIIPSNGSKPEGETNKQLDSNPAIETKISTREEEILNAEINQCIREIIEINKSVANEGEDDVAPPRKKIKLNDGESASSSTAVNVCTKPQQIVKPLVGSTFWPSNWRKTLCKCTNCLELYKKFNVEYIVDLEDTVLFYQNKGISKMEEESNSEMDAEMRALNRLDHVGRIEVVMGYNKLKENLTEFLKPFIGGQRVVTVDDVNGFFQKMKESDKKKRDK